MFCDREARIYWLNWKEMFDAAEERQDEYFYKLSAILANTVEGWCGRENLLEWAGEELCEDIGFDPAVMVHVRNTLWPWERMMADLQAFSGAYPDMVLKVTFIEGDAEGQAYLSSGRHTVALYNPETGKLYLAF